MKKFDKKAGLSFGIGMVVFLIIQNLWTADSLTTTTVIKSIVTGLLTGIISGFIFALIIGWFKTSVFVDKTTKIDTHADEDILFQTGANHFKGAEGVGGKLYLTNKRLVFKSHKLNVQNHEFSINLADISKVDKYKSLGIVNNGLTVTSKNNSVDKFVVEQVDEWIKKLN